MMIDVYLRNSDRAEGLLLGQVPFNKASIDGVIPLLRSWGVVARGDLVADDQILGQFVLDDDAAYFEVVVGEDAW